MEGTTHPIFALMEESEVALHHKLFKDSFFKRRKAVKDITQLLPKYHPGTGEKIKWRVLEVNSKGTFDPETGTPLKSSDPTVAFICSANPTGILLYYPKVPCVFKLTPFNPAGPFTPILQFTGASWKPISLDENAEAVNLEEQ